MKNAQLGGCMGLVLVICLVIGGFLWGYSAARQPGHQLFYVSDETVNNLKCLGAVVGTIALISLGHVFSLTSQLVGGFRERQQAAGIQDRVEQDIKVMSAVAGAQARQHGMLSRENSLLRRLLGSQKPPELAPPEPQYGLQFDDSQFSDLDDYIDAEVGENE